MKMKIYSNRKILLHILQVKKIPTKSKILIQKGKKSADWTQIFIVEMRKIPKSIQVSKSYYTSQRL